MANELNIQLDPFTETGLTLIAKVFNKAGTQQGSDVSMSESSTGFYTGDFALGAIADGDYTVKFQTTTDFYGSGILSVKDNAEFVASTLTTAQVAAELTTYDAPTKSELDLAQSAIESSITGLNNLSAADVNAEVDTALSNYDGPTKAELDSAVSGLSTFDPINDTVSNVTLVATVTTNSDMRGTDGALTDDSSTTASLNAIKTKTDQINFNGSDVKATLDGEQVTTDNASRLASQNDLTTISSDIAQTRKRVSNRRKIDHSANTETVYDDDKTTALYVSDLKDKDGNPTTESPFEIVPQ